MRLSLGVGDEIDVAKVYLRCHVHCQSWAVPVFSTRVASDSSDDAADVIHYPESLLIAALTTSLSSFCWADSHAHC